ncbi:MAG: hypothetical protein SOV79_17640 [Eisenbergiella porci]|nr:MULTISPECIES: hypothetical protein [Eisenbergiella]MDY2654372.1 hypothetical protein [Eisenbergiella porci]
MLSGGQKQRLLLARMLLEHPSLYFGRCHKRPRQNYGRKAHF